jgi:hypothetical protein
MAWPSFRNRAYQVFLCSFLYSAFILFTFLSSGIVFPLSSPFVVVPEIVARFLGVLFIPRAVALAFAAALPYSVWPYLFPACWIPLSVIGVLLKYAVPFPAGFVVWPLISLIMTMEQFISVAIWRMWRAKRVAPYGHRLDTQDIVVAFLVFVIVGPGMCVGLLSHVTCVSQVPSGERRMRVFLPYPILSSAELHWANWILFFVLLFFSSHTPSYSFLTTLQH